MVDYSKSKQCRECRKIVKALWEKNNRGKYLETKRREHKKNRVARLETMHKNYAANMSIPGYREKENARKSAWKKNNPSFAAQVEKTRQDAKRRQTPKWLSEKQREEMDLFYQDCREINWLCDGQLSVDHIVPIQGKSVRGLHVPWNLQIITKKENNKKYNNFVGGGL